MTSSQHPALPDSAEADGIVLDVIDDSAALFLGDVDAPDAVTGAVALQGGHVLSWCPPGGDEVLFVSDLARFEPGVAVRGGIPVCFPWFGAGITGAMTPSHGPARVTAWDLVEAVRDGEGYRVHLRLPAADGAPELHLRVRWGAELVLDVTAFGRAGQECELALHSYFGVGDVGEVEVTGLAERHYLDQLTGERRTQEGAVRFAAEVDRVYDAAGPVRITDPTLGRSITITAEGLGSAVVWNPWADKAARTADLGDDEWRGFVCVESGAVKDRPLVLDEQGRAQARVTISVEELEPDGPPEPPAGAGAASAVTA